MMLRNSQDKKLLYREKTIKEWLKYDLLETLKDISKT